MDDSGALAMTQEELDDRQKKIAAGMRNMGMQSHEGLRNAARPGISERIFEARSRYLRETGKNPTTIYLGEYELCELRTVATRHGTHTTEHVFGMEIVPVRRERHLAVH